MLKKPHFLFTDLHLEKQHGCKYFYITQLVDETREEKDVAAGFSLRDPQVINPVWWHRLDGCPFRAMLAA